MLQQLRAMSSSALPGVGPIASAIQRKLQEALKPVSLQLVNDSQKHSGHWVDDGSQASRVGETHFSVIVDLIVDLISKVISNPGFVNLCRLEVVSDTFAGLPLVKRHQLVYGLLQDELKAGLHAISMQLKTPDELQPK